MADPLPVAHPLRIGALSPRKPTRFALEPDSAARAEVARLLGISAVPRLSFVGAIEPSGRSDYTLRGRLEATVVQPCIVTLEPVTTTIDVPVLRRYTADFAPPTEDEAEMPEDDTVEQLGDVIDPGAVMFEALALALPDYPRAPGAELGEVVHAAPGVTPLRDADLRPFAGLAALAGKLSQGGSGSSGDGSG